MSAMNLEQWMPDNGDAPHMADEVLWEVLDLAQADTCVFVRVAEVDGELYFTGVEVVGDTLDGRLTARLDGQQAAPECARLIRRPASTERFTDHCLAAVEQAACLQLLVYDEDECVGCILALRWPPQASFSETCRRRLDRQARTIRDELLRARNESKTPSEPMYVLCRRSGEIAGGCSLANTWLDARRAARLETVVSAARECDGPCLVDGMLTQLSPIRAGDDLAMIVVRLELAPAATMAPDAALTPTQREVAEFAVAGATANEIAEAMNRSVHTVRSHLKNIYERLQVASRLELAEVLRG